MILHRLLLSPTLLVFVMHALPCLTVPAVAQMDKGSPFSVEVKTNAKPTVQFVKKDKNLVLAKIYTETTEGLFKFHDNAQELTAASWILSISLLEYENQSLEIEFQYTLHILGELFDSIKTPPISITSSENAEDKVVGIWQKSIFIPANQNLVNAALAQPDALESSSAELKKKQSIWAVSVKLSVDDILIRTLGQYWLDQFHYEKFLSNAKRAFNSDVLTKVFRDKRERRLEMERQSMEVEEEKRRAYETLVMRRRLMEENTQIQYVLHQGKSGDVRNWKLLQKGMSRRDVQAILDRPQNKDDVNESLCNYERWNYPKGKVYFFDSKLAKWDAPAAKRIPVLKVDEKIND